VLQVCGARRGAVRAEAGDGLEPAHGVAELSGEEDAREEQEVLAPLARAQRDERGAERAPPRRKRNDLAAGGNGHAPILRRPARREKGRREAPGGLCDHSRPCASASRWATRLPARTRRS